MDIYLINLDRSPERLAFMRQQLAGLDFIRFPAVDGSSMRDGIESHLSDGEIGCLLSHRGVWQKLIESGKPFACVLEDDAELSADAANFIGSEDWLPRDFDLVKIDTFFRKCIVTDDGERSYSGRRLLRLRSMHLCTAAYIISRSCAIEMLERTKLLLNPVDRVIFGDEAAKDFRVFQVSPAAVRQCETLESTMLTGRYTKKPRGLMKAARELGKAIRHTGEFFMTRRPGTRKVIIDYRS